MPDHTAVERPLFGTGAVFLTAISTILGAILFLRFGYAVGHVGFLGVLVIIVLGHLVTIPTALAIAEIATNRRVEGGGIYYILSRSFGINIGAAIGVALFFSQAVSVAFYIIAFAQAFDPLLPVVREHTGLALTDHRVISLPATLLLVLLIVTRGADLGVKALYVVVSVLFLSLLLFFTGSPISPSNGFGRLLANVDDHDPFFKVFAICFPAFTGMAAGVGLSGDLRDPKKAIPAGTLGATVAGMLIYVAVAYKLAVSATPEQLTGDQLIMSQIAVWGPIIPIGLGAATLSSALGSFLIAPRTLQALGNDGVLSRPLNGWLVRTPAGSAEPINAVLVSAAIAVFFVAIGDVNFVAQIISMIFMVTYGSICLVSFLEHFAADPSYRPAFRSRWYISLFGAVTCLWIAFQMSDTYAALSLALMVALYYVISTAAERPRGLSTMFQGAISQIGRQLQVFLQKSQVDGGPHSSRPAVVCVSSSSFERIAGFDLLRWISHRYGFGTYLHFIKGYVSRASHREARETLGRLVHLANVSDSNVYVDTIVSPSYTSAIAQVLQIPGISGKENNTILFEYSKREPDDLDDIVDNYPLVSSLDFDVLMLGSSDRGFGYFREIHIWITTSDYENANLMILLAYILLGHPDWRKADIRIFCLLPREDHEAKQRELTELIRSGRLPIPLKNLEFIAEEGDRDRREIVAERSRSADLVLLGFRGEVLKRKGKDFFLGYDGVGNVLFVNTRKEIDLVGEETPAGREQRPADALAGSAPADDGAADDGRDHADSRAADGASGKGPSDG